MFNEYPYVNLQDVNLDWILKHIKDLENNLQDFIKLNTVKYADPIDWDISRQYEANTVVVDPFTGVAYLSTQPVPTGVNITNTDYWTPIFTLDFVNMNKNITMRNDGNNNIATFPSVVNDWLIVGGQLYKVTQNIPVGNNYIVGTNIDTYSVELFIKDYVTNILNLMGDLDDLTTSDKTSIVNAINSVLSDLNTTIGNLNDLTTSDRTSVVNAINEIKNDCTTLINTLSEIVIRPEDYGAVGDGITDDSAAIMAAINASNNRPVYFTADKTYGISQSISLISNIVLVGNGATIKCLDTTMEYVIGASNVENVIIYNLNIDGNAPIETVRTNTHMWVNGLVQFHNSNHIILNGLKVYNIRFQQSGIVIQGNNNEVLNCEVYSGAGNRFNSGIITGVVHWPNLVTDGGSEYCIIHNCYVHDISTGTTPSESGYGIYFMASKHCECYSNKVIDCNWVCINSQTESGLSWGSDINIHDNFTKIDNANVYPRSDYIGPYNIYIEATTNVSITNNSLICGTCATGNYIPLCVSEDCDKTVVYGNRFILGSTDKTRYLTSFGCECVYDSNTCNFTPTRFTLIYNDPHIKLTLLNSEIKSTNNIIDINKGGLLTITGYIKIDNCILNSSTLKLIDAPKDCDIDFKITNCKINVVDFMLDYANGYTLIENNDIEMSGNDGITIRYGSGTKRIINNKIHKIGNAPAINVLGSDTTYDLIEVSGNYIEADNDAIRSTDAPITNFKVNNNFIVASNRFVGIHNSTKTIITLSVLNNTVKNSVLFMYNHLMITKGFVCNNVGAGISSIGITTSSNVIVENNQCIA